jgi:hypothetical protein
MIRHGDDIAVALVLGSATPPFVPWSPVKESVNQPTPDLWY